MKSQVIKEEKCSKAQMVPDVRCPLIDRRE
jgi:hypothetical protein